MFCRRCSVPCSKELPAQAQGSSLHTEISAPGLDKTGCDLVLPALVSGVSAERLPLSDYASSAQQNSAKSNPGRPHHLGLAWQHRCHAACTVPAARLSAAAQPTRCLLQGAGEGACSTAALRSTNVALGLVCWWLLLQSYRMLHPGTTGRQALIMVSATACLPKLPACLTLKYV